MALDVATIYFQRTQVDPAYMPELALALPVQLAASTTYPAGSAIGELTATPGTFGLYASGNSDGSQNARAILRFACVTDSSGNIFLGSTAAGDFGRSEKSVAAFFSGFFRTADIPNLDATGVTALGRIVKGVIGSGVLAVR